MKSRWLAVLLLAVFLLAVGLAAGCGGDDKPLSPGGSRMGEPRYHDGEGMEIRILTYRGRDLYCIEAGQLGSENGYALTCDFIAWHEANDPQ